MTNFFSDFYRHRFFKGHVDYATAIKSGIPVQPPFPPLMGNGAKKDLIANLGKRNYQWSEYNVGKAKMKDETRRFVGRTFAPYVNVHLVQSLMAIPGQR